MANLELGSSPEHFSTLTRKNLETIRRRYGDGGPESKLEYHNEPHTLEVIRATKKMVKLWNEKFRDEPITAREEMLLEIAASGHDIVQDAKARLGENFRHGDNERLSADDIADGMRMAGGFSEYDIVFVRACILGTIPEFGADRLGQPMTETRAMLERNEISEYQLELAKLLADADLASFGQGFEAFSKWAFRLFKEMKKKPEEFQDYLAYEVSVLENHEWQSKVGDEAFPHKQESIAKLKEMIEKGATIA